MATIVGRANGQKKRQQQIPFGDDNKKAKTTAIAKTKCGGSSTAPPTMKL
jgi:hypothetical protein